MTIATVRLRKEATIGRYQLVAEQELDKNDLSYRVMQQVFDYYQLPLFEDEYHYIYSDTFDTIHQQDVMKLVENVIYKVSKAINHSFYQDPQLLTNLYAHLSMRLSRKKNLSMNIILLKKISSRNTRNYLMRSSKQFDKK